MSSIHVLSLEIMFVVCSGVGSKLKEGEGARLIKNDYMVMYYFSNKSGGLSRS